MTDELKPCPFCGGEAACIEDGSHSTAWEIGCYNGQCAAEPSVWEPRKEVAITAWNTRADLATPAPAVKVKALVWEEPCAANNHIYMARAPWGTYGIHIDGGRHRAWLEAHEKPYERWLGDCDVGSLYEAQDAAEEDNEKRTRELIYTTPLDDPRVKALVKKARAVVDRWDSPLWKDLRHTGTLINELRATISALEENK